MTLKGGTAPACAACKYQRRRCTPNCPLAPYFPANQAKMFQSVHRLFGVSNVTKTLKSLKTKVEKDDAMKSIIYEADIRKMFPVHGCTAVITGLQTQLQYALAELRCVHAQLAAYKEQPPDKPVDLSQQCWPSTSFQIENVADLGTDRIDFLALNPELPANQLLMNEFGFYSEYGDINISNTPFFGLDSSLETGSSDAIQAIQARMDAFGIQNCEDVPFNSIDNDKNSCIDTKEICQSSLESSPKDTTRQLMELNVSSKE